MAQHLLAEIERGSKNALTKKKVITYYMYNRLSTIPDLSKELDLSVPTVTKLIMENKKLMKVVLLHCMD